VFAFRYCQAQRSNAKTTAVLEKAFAHLGDIPKSVLVTRYVYEVLFDHEFYYDTDQAFKDRLRRDTAGLGEGATAEALQRFARSIEGGATGINNGVRQGMEQARRGAAPSMEPEPVVQNRHEPPAAPLEGSDNKHAASAPQEALSRT
jgi:hypothetical protein